MAKDGIELVSVTNHFKFQAPDASTIHITTSKRNSDTEGSVGFPLRAAELNLL